jgi:hypothetical protein
MIKQQRFALILLFFLTITIVSFVKAQDKNSDKDRDSDGEKTASFQVQKDGKLDMRVDYGNITIIPWNKSEVFIRANDFDPEELEYIRMKGDKNRVTVRFDMKGEDYEGGDGDFEINVPTDFEVELSTGGGNVEIQGDLRGAVRGSSGGGNITLKNVTNGNLNLSTGGGDMRAGSIGGDVELSTGGGNISIEDIHGNIVASTGGGNITLGKADGVATISTGGGNIRINGAGGKVELSTGGGNIDVKDVSGKVRASTGGGNVDLTEITGSISASTGGGEITAELNPSGKGGSELSTGGGDIKLYIPENAKATIEAVIEIPRKWSKNIKKYKIESDYKAESYEQDEKDEEIRATYLINGGGEKIILKTSNANINIKKLKK